MYRTLYRLLCRLALLIWPVAGIAQGQLLSIEYFGEDKGLNITGLNDILQDREGFLWLATREGLVRFDGHSFRYFRKEQGDSTSIYSNHLYCLSEDAEGNIWAGLARGGVSCYNRRTGRFRNYPFTEKLEIKTVPVVRIFFDRDGETWVGLTGYGLMHLDRTSGEFKTYELVTTRSAPHLTREELFYYNTAQNFWQDETGLFWCATSDDLYTFDPQTGETRSHRFHKIAPTGFWQNQAYALLPEGDSLWVGGWGSGLRRYHRKTGEWKQYLWEKDSPAPDAINVVNKIIRKSATELWITSADRGLGIFNTQTETFRFLHEHPQDFPGFPEGNMDDLLVDRQGNLWLDQGGQLLRMQLKDRQFQFISVRSDRPVSREYSWISVMMDERDGPLRLIGLSAGDGLRVVDRDTGNTTVPGFTVQPGAEESSWQVRDLLQCRDGTIWVLGRHLLYRFDPQTKQLELPPQPPVYSPETGSNFYTQIAEDGRGDLWLGTSLYGLFRYSPDTGETKHFMPEAGRAGALPTNVIGVVHADGQGRIWFGSRDKTAYGYYRPEEDRFVYLDADGRPTPEVSSMRMNDFFTDDRGDIWACSEQGILHFDCSAEQPRPVRKYTVSDGLTSDYVAQGVAADDGSLWLAVARNLLRFDPATGQVTAFGQQEGVPPLHNGIGKFGDGSLYLQGQHGYFRFEPDSLILVEDRHPLVLSSFKVNDREQYRGSEWTLTDPLVVPTDGRYFTLEYAALDLAHPELCRYEYQLEGLERHWVRAGNRHFVNYTNVPAGKYLFRVKREGQPDSEALSVPLVVKVAFYERGWFWTLIAILLSGAAWIYYRNRQRQRQQFAVLKSKAQLLEKEKALVQYESLKQQLNPHFLFNSLTSLGSLIAIDPRAATGFLENLSKTYRYILKSSEREVVPLEQELKFGESFVQLQQTRFGEGLQVHFRVAEEHYHRKIVPVTLQNLLENAIKHNIIDEEEPLVVEVFVEDNYLVVRNNLQKKKFVETSNKRGLHNLRSFYRYLSDRPVLVSEETKFFTIMIPLI